LPARSLPVAQAGIAIKTSGDRREPGRIAAMPRAGCRARHGCRASFDHALFGASQWDPL